MSSIENPAKIEVLGKTANNAVSAQNIQAGTADARNEIDDEETDVDDEEDDKGEEESRRRCCEQSYFDRFVGENRPFTRVENTKLTLLSLITNYVRSSMTIKI